LDKRIVQSKLLQGLRFSTKKSVTIALQVRNELAVKDLQQYINLLKFQYLYGITQTRAFNCKLDRYESTNTHGTQMLRKLTFSLTLLLAVSSAFNNSYAQTGSDTLTQNFFQHLPFTTLHGLANYSPPAIHAYRTDINLFGNALSGDAVILNGMAVQNADMFPLIGLSSYQLNYRQIPLRYGNHCGAAIQLQVLADTAFNWKLSANTNFGGNGYRNSQIQGLISHKKSLGIMDIELLYTARLDIQNDFNPTQGTYWTATSAAQSNLEADPFRPTGTGFGAFVNTEFIRESALVESGAPAVAGGNTNTHYAMARFLFQNDFTVSLNAYGNWRTGRLDIHENQLFNAAQNPALNDQHGNVWLQVRKEFNDLAVKPYVALQVGTQREKHKVQSEAYGDDFWRYGYIGEYTVYTARSYEFQQVGNQTGRIHNGWDDTLVTFQPAADNLLADYVSDYYDSWQGTAPAFENFTQMLDAGVPRNGDRPQSSYGLWNSPGQVNDQYVESDSRRTNIRLETGLTLGAHTFELGIAWNQWRESYYSLAPVGLWTKARSLANSHIRELDLTSGETSVVGNFFTTDYDRLLGSDQSDFDRNLRESLGLPADGTDFIHIDVLSPDQLSLDLFSANELSGLLVYQGYDHLGNRLSGNVDQTAYMNDFATIAPFQPIYGAVYIHDKFEYKHVQGDIGLRVDYYNANQPALKDPYLWFAPGELDDLSAIQSAYPNDVPQNSVIYVNDINDPTAIVGYRFEDTWYDVDGNEVTDPSVMESATGMAPYLADANAQSATDIVLKDVATVLNILPQFHIAVTAIANTRISLHHQTSTKNPLMEQSAFRPDQLVNIQISNPVINNPDLKPMRIEYSSAMIEWKMPLNIVLSVEGFRTKIDNEIFVVTRSQAYPCTYRTYGNILGNYWHGFTPKISILDPTALLSFQVHYTKQFGGTMTRPYSENMYGAHMMLQLNKLFGQRLLAHNGAYLSASYNYRDAAFRYTPSSNSYAAAYGSTGGSISGQLNAGEMPAVHSVSLRIEKEFPIRENGLRVFLQAENLFFSEQVQHVYRYTGLPSDDGYLTSDWAQSSIEQQNDELAFRDQYGIKVNSPYNYGAPTVFRFGIVLSN
jgi:hypothetical protein